MSVPESQENPWTFVAANPERIRAVKERLETYEVKDPKHVAIVVAVLDQHGLFCEVVTPKPGDKSKDIRRRAKRMVKMLWKRISSIRNGKELPTDSQEADLAERWEQLGADQMRLEELKVVSETFQINRGGRIIPRYTSRKNRKNSPQGPRSEPEITHALQILDRYLEEEYLMRTNQRMERLGGILQSAMNWQDSPDSVVERVRSRLKEARKKTPLDDVDYYEATRVSYKLNDDRQVMFWKYQSILCSPDTSAEEKKTAEDARRKLFPFDWSRLR